MSSPSIDSQSTRIGDQTPSMADTINTLISQQLLNTNTALPGKILEYDFKTQRAVVQPLFDVVFSDNDRIQLRPISNVPVQFSRSTNSFVHLPGGEEPLEKVG